MTSAVNRPRAVGRPGETIGFKLAPELHDAFVRLAASRGQSPGLYAKELCVQALRDKAAPEVSHPDLARLMTDLRRSLGQSVLALLILAGGVNAEEAIRWTKGTWPDREGGQG